MRREYLRRVGVGSAHGSGDLVPFVGREGDVGAADDFAQDGPLAGGKGSVGHREDGQ